MKTRYVLVLIGCFAALFQLPAQSLRPAVLGAPTPAREAMPAPETVLLHALSNDGRWLLLSAAHDRLAVHDHNAAADVFQFDRTTGKILLVSAATNGLSGNGTSLAGGASADGGRVAWMSRASDLVSSDTNRTWDVFVRDLPEGAIHRVSADASVGGSTEPSSDPFISTDGRYVIFASPARDWGSDPFLLAFNLYRRDLIENRLECLTTEAPFAGQPSWKLGDWRTTPDARKLAYVANPLPTATGSNVVVWRDLTTGRSANCAFNLASELGNLGRVTHSAVAISNDGRFVAFRSEGTVDSAAYLYGLSLHDVDQGLTTLLSLRTNQVPLPTHQADLFQAALSAEGQFIAYAAPWPRYDPSTSVFTNGPEQVYLYETPSQTTRLISAEPDGVTPANADADGVRLTPDGGTILFASRATNLLASASTAADRLYAWNRESGTLRVLGELGDGNSEGRVVVSPNGSWCAMRVDADGSPRVRYFQLAEDTADDVDLPLVIEQSSTSRGWMGVHPTGVSADGRYVALTAFPSAPEGTYPPVQIYVQDTRDGGRRLLTQGADGTMGNGQVLPPSLSADGSKTLFQSAATNLVPDDTNGLADVFVQTIATGERTRLRQSPLPAEAIPETPSLISPDGGVAFLTFREGTKPVSRLADVASGLFTASFPGLAVGLPSFNHSGRKVAVSLGSAPGGANPRVEIHEIAAWFAEGLNPVPALWTSPVNAVEPLLSADGSRVAYLHVSRFGTNAVVVMDWTKDQPLFTRTLGKQVPSGLALSADGRFVVWISPGAAPDSPDQVWCADIDAGTLELVSVSGDGAGEANDYSKYTAISADGRLVAFASVADNLVDGDFNGAKDVFLRDRQTGRTLLVSGTPAGRSGRGWSLQPFFSADGRSLFFLSHAPDLTPDDCNQSVDLFKVELIEDSGLPIVLRRDLSTGQPTLIWNGTPAKSYQIQYKDQLEAETWSSHPGNYTGSGRVDLDPTERPHRFFRVVEAP